MTSSWKSSVRAAVWLEEPVIRHTPDHLAQGRPVPGFVQLVLQRKDTARSARHFCHPRLGSRRSDACRHLLKVAGEQPLRLQRERVQKRNKCVATRCERPSTLSYVRMNSPYWAVQGPRIVMTVIELSIFPGIVVWLSDRVSPAEWPLLMTFSNTRHPSSVTIAIASNMCRSGSKSNLQNLHDLLPPSFVFCHRDSFDHFWKTHVSILSLVRIQHRKGTGMEAHATAQRHPTNITISAFDPLRAIENEN